MSTLPESDSVAFGVDSRDVMDNYRHIVRRRIIMLLLLTLLIVASLLLDFVMGPSGLSLQALWQTLTDPASVSAGTRAIVWDIRMPYSLMAIVVGLALGLAGAEMQTILNNPLASPFTLGVSSAAAFGAALAIVLGIGIPGIPGQWFTSANPLEGIPGAQRLAPQAHYWLGTDQLGRDLWTRVVYGAVHSLSAALIAVAIGLVVGTALGTLAGELAGRVESTIMRLVDVLLAIPSLLLQLTVIILLGFGTVNAAVAVGVAAIASFARLARAEVVRVRHSDYVEAARGSGGTFFAVFWRHFLPNSLTAVLAFATLQFGQAMLALATLSFLGYGTPPPVPEWGLLIAEGRNYLSTAWWLTTFPGLAVVAVVLAANRLSRQWSGVRP